MSKRDFQDDHLSAWADAVMTRRQAVQRLGLGVGVLAAGGWLAACGGDSESGGGSVRKGGSLTIGAQADEYPLSGGGANVGWYPLNANIFEGLVRMDPAFGLVPALAESWSLRDENTWRFELRRGVEMHDGSPFTAESVRYSFDRVGAAGYNIPRLVKGGTKIVDDYTVDITPEVPNQRLVEQIVHPYFSIVAAGTDPVKKPTGSGPFRFGSYEREQRLVVKRFAGYWGTPAILDELTFEFIPDANARRLALEAGDVQLILGVPNAAAASLASKGFRVSVAPVGAYEAMYANIGGKKGYTLLQDRAVRQAIEYAIDREALVEGVFNGQAEVEQTMVPSRLLGAHADTVGGYEHDPAKAQRLLEQAGWTSAGDGARKKGDRSLELELVSGFPSASDHPGVAEFIQDQLKRVGVAVKIVNTPDFAAYDARMSSLRGDLWLERGNQNDADPSFLPSVLFSKLAEGAYAKLFAAGAVFDATIAKALAARGEDAAQKLVASAMHTLIDEEAIVVPLAGVGNITAASEKIRGFEAQPSALQVRYDRLALSA